MGGKIRTTIMAEQGYPFAIEGLSLSYEKSIERAIEVSKTLKDKDHGENKFLESIDVWVKVSAPRNFWQEADTYRLTTKQSGSTMHTLHKRNLTQDDFNSTVHPVYLTYLNDLIRLYNSNKTSKNLETLKDAIPEGFLQTRVWKLNYSNIREILIARTHHKLPSWKIFCQYLRDHLQHPELLPKE